MPILEDKDVATVSTRPRIRSLPPGVVTKIAAGEVIERPASVVKELLENSLDAGAGRIDVAVEQGGAELIRVVDDGSGFHPEDLALAFANHATSKLRDADDLFAVGTMGFRGEALASIGGVSQVVLQSRRPDSETGAEIACRGGELSPIKPWNGSPGTRIEVRHLFWNTPVRRKFLRTPATEIGHICEALTRVALARPGLHLSLIHNDKKVHEVPGGASLLERIGLFFGPEVAEKLHAVEGQAGPVRLFGYVADPACDRGNPRMQYLFLNGRWIRDRSLSHAVQEAFRGLLMTGRYAVSFLFLELPPDHVDVNVHPTKSEVRFRDGQGLYSFVLHTIRDALTRENLTARLRVPAGGTLGGLPAGSTNHWLQAQQMEQSPSLFGQAGFPTFHRPPVIGPSRIDPALPSPPGSVESSRPAEGMVPGGQGNSTPAEPLPGGPLPEGAGNAEFGGEGGPVGRILGGTEPLKAIQLYDTYLVLETPEGMLVIDQHALHERILFEHLQDRVREGSLETQQLLIPEPVELKADQAARLLDQRGALGELGLGVEEFGGSTVLLTRYPALLGRTPPVEILKAVVDHLASKERLPAREVLLGDLMSTMACRAAVKAGDPLTAEEIADLVAQRHLARDAHHCPHGRPTALLFSRHDLERQFRRI